MAVGTDNVLNADAAPSASIPVTVINLGISPASLPSANVGASYSATITASGGTSPYAYTVSSGDLPPGLSLNPSSGVISGTPTGGGCLQLHDRRKRFGRSARRRLAGVHAHGERTHSGPQPVHVARRNVRRGVCPDHQRLGWHEPPYTFAQTGGTLPPGLTLSNGGVLSGTPTTAGSYTFLVTATDSSTGTGPYTASQSYTVAINKAVLTVTANPASMTYGAASLPTFTDTITGFVNGDTQSVVSGSASLTTTATHSSPSGSYTITAAQGSLSPPTTPSPSSTAH